MPEDWIFYWMTRPFGLAVIGVATLLPFGIWRLVLGSTYGRVGIRPYVVGYVFSLVGLMLLSFCLSYFEFSGRVATGALSETQRWTTVLGWSVYLAVLSLIFVLPMLGIVGVPVSAFLLRRKLLNFGNIAKTVLVLWIALTCILWSLPGNEWQRTHRLESFTSILASLMPGIVLVAFPFLIGLHLVTREGRTRKLK